MAKGNKNMEVKTYNIPDLSGIKDYIDVIEENIAFNSTMLDLYKRLGEKRENGNATIFFENVPDDEFIIEFLYEVDTGKKIARFTKPKISKKYDIVISAMQLQNMVELKYSGFRIEHATTMVAYIKERCRQCFSKPIADSIGFSSDRKLFYNAEYIPSTKDFDIKELNDCWFKLLEVPEFKKIFFWSFTGLLASFIDETIVPIVNICGSALDTEFLRTLILSSFGDPRKGYRDYFAKSDQNSKLSMDKSIIPIIIDTVSYDEKYDFSMSDYGYYTNNLGVCTAPLFVFSSKPLDNFQVGIEIPRNIFPTDKETYKKMLEMKDVLIRHSGQLAFYIADVLIKRSQISDPNFFNLAYVKYSETNYIKINFIEELNDLMEDSGFLPSAVKSNKLEAIRCVLMNVLNDDELFEGTFSDNDILVGWDSANVTRNEIRLYEGILSLLHKHEYAYSKDAFCEEYCDYWVNNGYCPYANKNENKNDDAWKNINSRIFIGNEADCKHWEEKEKCKYWSKKNHCGFIEYKRDKLYFFVQEGFLSEIVPFERKERDRILEQWSKKMDNSQRGDNINQPFLTRIYAGRLSDGSKKRGRDRFYKFCLSDLEMAYPEIKAVSRVLIQNLIGQLVKEADRQEDNSK